MSVRAAGACWARAACAAVAVAAACEPIERPRGSGAPENVCPDHPCTAYVHGPAAACGADGACTAGPLPATGIELVVAIPEDSLFAPSMQYVVPYEHLADCAAPQICTCRWPACGHLPYADAVAGAYVMSACVQTAGCGGLGFFLGNQDAFGATVATWLPAHATYRLLQDAWHNDVAALGLPVSPVQAEQTVVAPGLGLPGPYAGPSLEFTFKNGLPPGTYERTIAPDPAYDAVFGPDVHDVTVSSRSRPFDPVAVDSFDHTSEIPEFQGTATLPTFDISRACTPNTPQPCLLDGWTALLRDATTKRVISNVQQLAGTVVRGVRLVTHHLTPTVTDALTNAELVVAPPTGAPLPTGVFSPTGGELPQAELYPSLPPPVTLTGSITGPNRVPIAADLVFEALAFADEAGVYKYPQFEFVGRASARPGPDGSSTYSVALPLGPYRVDVRPLDGSVAMTVAVLEVSATRVRQDFALAPRTVAGTAVLADGRPLVAATVEAVPLPQGCPTPPALADGGATGLLKPLDSTPWCLPRPQQTVTDSSGSFTLPLDAGGYRVRVKPSDGTRLPWVSRSIQVGDFPPPLSFVVPAPFHSTFMLQGADGSAIARAVVRAFAGAVEVGQTFTGVDGACDLYLALPE